MSVPPPPQRPVLVARFLDDLLLDTAEIGDFFVRFFTEGIFPPYEVRQVLRHCYIVGNKTLFLVSLAAFVLGLVLILQSRPTLVEFGAGSYLPSMAAVSIIREIGPLITSLICAGKIGSGISAELGSMRVTEQIDAMEVSGTNPFKYLVATRMIATMLTVPVLTIYADLVSLLGSWVGANVKDSLDFSYYFSRIFDTLDFRDIVPSVLKTFVFGFAIALISSSKGYHSKNGTAGVGRATNASVVLSMVTVLIIDMVVTQLSAMLGYLGEV